MKKFIKTSIVAMAILAFGLIMMNKSNAQESADVYLTVNEWTLTITASWSINLWAVTSPTVDTDLSWQFSADSFYVTDYKWSMSGYYTTIQVTDLTGNIGTTTYTIPAANVEFKSNTATANPHLMTGTANSDVTMWSISTTYTAINSPITYFERNNNTTGGILSQYWDTPRVKVTVPAFQAATTYHGIITYTLYEPGN